MKMKWKERGKATPRRRCPDTRRANPQNHGTSGRKMHLEIVKRHFGKAMLLLLNIHGLRRLQGGTKKMILKMRQVSLLMIL